MNGKGNQRVDMARDALPDHIVFEKRDGMYWLEGRDLDTVRKATGLRCEAAKAGFDRLVLSVLISQLTVKHFKSACMDGASLRVLESPKPSPVPQTERIQLDPRALFDEREIQQIAARIDARPVERERLATWAKAFVSHSQGTLRELGCLYVYEVNPDMYEVDWRLTNMNESTVQILAIAAYHAGARLSCERVGSRNRRLRIAPHISSAAVRTPMVSFGQMTLPWTT